NDRVPIRGIAGSHHHRVSSARLALWMPEPTRWWSWWKRVHWRPAGGPPLGWMTVTRRRIRGWSIRIPFVIPRRTMTWRDFGKERRHELPQPEINFSQARPAFIAVEA